MAKRVTNLPLDSRLQDGLSDRKNYSNEPYSPEDSKHRRWTKPISQKVDINKASNSSGKLTSNKSSSNNWWVWALIIIVTILIVGLIQDWHRNKRLDDTAERAVNDVNYCRSLAAEYGMQGDAIFHKVYNDCMEVKGW